MDEWVGGRMWVRGWKDVNERVDGRMWERVMWMRGWVEGCGREGGWVMWMRGWVEGCGREGGWVMWMRGWVEGCGREGDVDERKDVDEHVRSGWKDVGETVGPNSLNLSWQHLSELLSRYPLNLVKLLHLF